MTVHKSLGYLSILLLSFSAASVFARSMKAVAQPLKNLNEITYHGKGVNNKVINKLYKNVKGNPYKLSMVLIGSALNGDRAEYKKIHHSMLDAMSMADSPKLITVAALAKSEKKPMFYYSWLLGRILISGMAMSDDSKSNKKILSICEDMLIGNMPRHSNEAFTYYAWSWGYLNIYYAQNKIAKYRKYRAYTPQFMEYMSVQKDISKNDVMWARVLNLYAAALASDYSGYKRLLKKLRKVNDITSAAQTKSNDFRAWAMAMTQLAAVVIHDHETSTLISQQLPAALKNKSESAAGRMLARVTSELAIANANYKKV